MTNINKLQKAGYLIPHDDTLNNVLARCKEVVRQKGVASIYAITEGMNKGINGIGLEKDKYFLMAVASFLHRTGNYSISDDHNVTLKYKPFTEKYWGLVEVAKIILGAVIGFALSEFLHR